MTAICPSSDSREVTPLDAVDHHRCGRSSSAAKKTDADFKIALARFNSRFSCSNSRIPVRFNLPLPQALRRPRDLHRLATVTRSW